MFLQVAIPKKDELPIISPLNSHIYPYSGWLIISIPFNYNRDYTYNTNYPQSTGRLPGAHAGTKGQNKNSTKTMSAKGWRELPGNQKRCLLQYTVPFYIYWLVVWTPLKNMKVSWDDGFQYVEKKKCSKPPTSIPCCHVTCTLCWGVWERNENCDKSDRLCHGGRTLGSAGHFHNSIVAIVVTSLVIIMINLIVKAIVMFNYPISWSHEYIYIYSN